MFTGIVQGIAQVAAITDKEGLRSFTLDFPEDFCQDLEIGASVACDGVCLTVTALKGDHGADFDVMLQSLNLTALGRLGVGGRLNVERAAKEGAEIGGHPLSGHVDFMATVETIRRPANNHVAVNGASLTVAEAGRHPDGSGWFEVWLIPETLRMTTFADKGEGAPLHIEIERQTQVMVDTVRDAVAEKIGALMPALKLFAQERGLDLDV